MEGGGKGARGGGGGGVPLIPRYNAHITFPPLPDHPPPPPSNRPSPPCAQVRLADVPCLTGKLNRYFTVSYPLRYPTLAPSLSFSPSSRPSLLPSLGGGGPLSSCPAAEQKSERERRRGRWPVDRTERRRGIFLPSNRTSESSSSSSSSMGQRRSAPLPAGTLCASCKYLSAYCITRHDNVRPRLRLSLPAPLPPPSLVLPPPSLYRG